MKNMKVQKIAVKIVIFCLLNREIL